MKQINLASYLTCLLLTNIAAITTSAQNVGIGTNAPTKKLSVNGTVVVDHNNTNEGSLDSASLLFGTAFAKVGISSNKILGFPNQGGLDFWTNSTKRLTLSFDGNLGINNSNPTFRLQVGGNSYVSGTSEVNSKLLVGGSPYNNNFDFNVNGYSFLNGRTSIGAASNSNEALYVQSVGGLAARFTGGNVVVTQDQYVWGKQQNGSTETGNLQASGVAAIGGDIDPAYKLRVYDGNARVGGDFHATGNAAIGGGVDNNFRLRVYDGNSRFGGNAEITGSTTVGSNLSIAGNTTIGGDVTIGGKGSVRSNGPSPLRLSFQQVSINQGLGTGGSSKQYKTVTLEDIADINDVRVFVSHFEPSDVSGVYGYYEYVIIKPDYVDPAANTIRLVLHNIASTGVGIKGTLYLGVIYKD